MVRAIDSHSGEGGYRQTFTSSLLEEPDGPSGPSKADAFLTWGANPWKQRVNTKAT